MGGMGGMGRETWAPVLVGREQSVPSLEYLIAADDPVRLFDEVLAGVDWAPWEAKYKAGKRGQPPIHPRFIAAAILYGLYRKIRSSRMVEEACCYRFDFMWLVQRQRFDHTTIAKFRTRFHAPLKDLFRQIGRTAINLGLIRLCEVAFDGTRVKANNSRYNTRTAPSLEQKLRALDELFEQLASECKAADDRGAKENSPTHLPENLAAVDKRRQQVTAALERARAADIARKKDGIDPKKNPAQVPMIDPDSRVMPNKEGGYAPNYTPTAVTDGQQGFILDCDVLAQVNESDALAESVDRIEETFGRKPETMLTDAGNSTGQNMAAMEERGIVLLTPAESHQPQAGNPACRADPRQPVPEDQWPDLPRNPQGQLDKSCFVYDASADQYYCPQGRPLPYAESKPRRVYRCADCGGCPLAAACVSAKSKQGRTITRDQYESVRERTAARMREPAARARYDQRPRIAETTFGILKSAMAFRQFLLRGLEKVKTEWQWAATAFNLVKLIRGIARLRAQFAALAQMT
jgi:transposase